jgi:hypothetical protein
MKKIIGQITNIVNLVKSLLGSGTFEEKAAEIKVLEKDVTEVVNEGKEAVEEVKEAVKPKASKAKPKAKK